MLVEKTGHWEKSVVDGISGQTSKIQPNDNTQKKVSLDNFGGSRNFRPNVNSQKKGHWEISVVVGISDQTLIVKKSVIGKLMSHFQ